MKFLALTTLLLASLATATPVPAERSCLTAAGAKAVVAAYTALTEKKGDVSSEADKLLGPDFTFLSDSFNILLGQAVRLTLPSSSSPL